MFKSPVTDGKNENMPIAKQLLPSTSEDDYTDQLDI